MIDFTDLGGPKNLYLFLLNAHVCNSRKSLFPSIRIFQASERNVYADMSFPVSSMYKIK